MPPMWAWNRSLRFQALAAELGVEVETTVDRPAAPEDLEQRQRDLFD